MTQPSNPDAAARDALRLIGADPPNWVPDSTGTNHNVTIVGGGQTGCAIAFALRRAGIGRVTIIDAAVDESQAGLWLNAARMNLLRTPKTLPGPELGIPAFSFQAWYEARHGAEAYAAIDRIRRLDWAEYLRWYRHFLGIPVRYRTRLQSIEPADGHFRLHLETDGVAATETTRKIVLATGFTGYGGAYVPPVLADALPRQIYAHTEDPIDFPALRGKAVAVIGAAASAFDAAGVALEVGRGVGASFRPANGDRRGADHPQPRLSGRLRQLPCAAGRDALGTGDPVPPFRLHADHRCDRARGGIPEFPSAPRGIVGFRPG